MRKTLILSLLACLSLVGCMGSTVEAPPPNQNMLTPRLVQAHYALNTIDELEAREVLAPAVASGQRQYYLRQAAAEAGTELTRDELAALVLGTNQGWWRFITFVNIIWLFASLMIVLALVYIFANYIFPLLKRVPLTFYEILLYAACFSLLYIAWDAFDPTIGQFVAMPALLGLLPLMPWSYERHILRRSRRGQKQKKSGGFKARRGALLGQHVLMTALYVGAALAFQSELIGFFAVVEGLLVVALAYVPEFIAAVLRQKVSDAAEEIVLVISGAMLLIWMGGEVYGLGGAYRLFETAVYILGTFIYFTVLEVVASRYYRRERERFWTWQAIAVVSGLVGLFLGVFLEIDTLQETAGTFLLIYLLTKYVEVIRWRYYWMWGLLLLGLLLYGVALMLNQYPGYFLFG